MDADDGVDAAFFVIEKAAASVPRWNGRPRLVVSCVLALMTVTSLSVSSCVSSESGDGKRQINALIYSAETDMAGPGHGRQFSDRPRATLAPLGEDSKRRSLATSSPELAMWANPFLFLKDTPRTVVSHTPDAGINIANAELATCYAIIRNIVFVPNDSVFYYVLDERCERDDGEMIDWLLSVRKRNLSVVSKPGKVHGRMPTSLISYGWRVGNPDGPAIWSRNASMPNKSLAPMAWVNAMDLSRSGEYLVLSSRDRGGNRNSGKLSNLTFLSTGSGKRTSAMVGKSADSLTLDPAKTRLYIALNGGPSLLLFTDVDKQGKPINGSSSWRIINPVTSDNDSNVDAESGFMAIGTQSFVADGSCLYYRGKTSSRLLGINLSPNSRSSSSSSSLPPMVSTEVSFVAGRWGLADFAGEDGDALNASFSSMRDMAVTKDGCNIFVAEPTKIRWVKVDSPCSLARSVETVVEYVESAYGFWGLALNEFNSRLNLYAGTMGGHVFELRINKSHLHVCAPPPSSPSLAPPSASPAAASSSTVTAHMAAAILTPPAESDSSFTPESSSDGVNTRVAEMEKDLQPVMATAPSSHQRKSAGTLALQIAVPIGALSLVAFVIAGLAVMRRRRSLSRRGEDPWRNAISTTESNGGDSPKFNGGHSLDLNGGDSSGAAAAGHAHGASPRLISAFCKRFPLATVSSWTCNFGDDCKVTAIGSGGVFGNVYQCCVGGTELALKVRTGDLTAKKITQLESEVNALGRLHHANVVPLIGYAQEGDRSILIYPYFRGGSLYARLHGKGKAMEGMPPPFPPLTLIERLCIGFQIAKAVQYLHDGISPPIIHGDIKSANVLLTGLGVEGGGGGGCEVRAVLADCGWATVCETVFGITHEEVTQEATAAGTFGYMAPEYLLAAQQSMKGDVYSVGVILLEMLTGTRSVRLAPSGIGCVPIADWANPIIREPDSSPNMLEELLDVSLHEQAESTSAKEMVMRAFRLASSCTDDNAQVRPPISAVAESIRQILEEGNPRSRFAIR